MIFTKSKIIENTRFYGQMPMQRQSTSEEVYSLTIATNEPLNIIPGQFFMINVEGKTLGRPISVCDVNGTNIRFLYKITGEGTKNLSQENDAVEVLGPLGNGFNLDEIKGTTALVSGGIGVAPLLYLAKSLYNRQKIRECVNLYAGFKDEAYLTGEFTPFVQDINIATETGKIGKKGFVIDHILLEKYDNIICCGPEIMMEKLGERCRKLGKNLIISMEKRMGCGVGACLVCSCKTTMSMKTCCKDGPVFCENVIDWGFK